MFMFCFVASRKKKRNPLGKTRQSRNLEKTPEDNLNSTTRLSVIKIEQ